MSFFIRTFFSKKKNNCNWCIDFIWEPKKASMGWRIVCNCF